jgi:hypothetical protein
MERIPARQAGTSGFKSLLPQYIKKGKNYTLKKANIQKVYKTIS